MFFFLNDNFVLKVDRRVEITGPVDRKMVINALNSGATQFMADFEGMVAVRDLI